LTRGHGVIDLDAAMQGYREFIGFPINGAILQGANPVLNEVLNGQNPTLPAVNYLRIQVTTATSKELSFKIITDSFNTWQEWAANTSRVRHAPRCAGSIVPFVHCIFICERAPVCHSA
jgi:hypothetical protein